jgi:glycosidase
VTGVDGFRLDAVPYLVERDGTSCENLPETHAVIKTIRRHMDAHSANRMLLARRTNHVGHPLERQIREPAATNELDHIQLRALTPFRME